MQLSGGTLSPASAESKIMKRNRDDILFQYIIEHLDRIWGALSPYVKKTILSWESYKVYSVPDTKTIPIEDLHSTLKSGTHEDIYDDSYYFFESSLLSDLSCEDNVIIIQDVFSAPNSHWAKKFKDCCAYHNDISYYIIDYSMRDMLDDVIFHVDFVHFLSLVVFEKYGDFEFKPGPIEENVLEKIANHTVKYVAGGFDGEGYIICEKV
jgi:hypothetical protein